MDQPRKRLPFYSNTSSVFEIIVHSVHIHVQRLQNKEMENKNKIITKMTAIDLHSIAGHNTRVHQHTMYNRRIST